MVVLNKLCLPDGNSRCDWRILIYTMYMLLLHKDNLLSIIEAYCYLLMIEIGDLIGLVLCFIMNCFVIDSRRTK